MFDEVEHIYFFLSITTTTGNLLEYNEKKREKPGSYIWKKKRNCSSTNNSRASSLALTEFELLSQCVQCKE